MALCWGCWKRFDSDDVCARVCNNCRAQRKLSAFCDDDTNGHA